MSNTLRLKYLIGADGELSCREDEIIVVPYGYEFRPTGIGTWVQYCNLLDERGTREFTPYLPDNDMTEQYGEPVPDPAGDGFWRNIRHQLDLAVAQGFKLVELDNLDSYTASVALLCFNEVQSRGLKVFVKNPFLVDGDHAALMRHPAACGAIVEPDCGTPDQMQAIRNGLPVYFVSGDYEDPSISFPDLATGQPMAWRLAKSLETLRSQVNAKWPTRDKSSDGTIGDAAHQATKSEHNPDENGVVRAMDITNDPGVLSSRALAEALINSRDPRIYYVISNGEIANPNISNGAWRPYNGSNPHDHHMHISVVDDPDLYDDQRPWNIGGSPVAQVPGRNYGITATYFGGSSDPNTSAYDGHLITDSEMGVALPYRFKGTRPKVRVFKGGKSVDCSIVDVGPWNINDPYWETGARPQAESGRDNTGRQTNKAGIDLTPAAAKAIGLNGKGLVDWEFVGNTNVPAPDPVTIPADPPATMEEAFARVEAALADLKESIRVAQQPAQPQIDLTAIVNIVQQLPQIIAAIQQVVTVMQTLGPILSIFGLKLPAITAVPDQPKTSVVNGTTVGAAGAGIGIGGLIVSVINALMQGKVPTQ